MTLERCLGSLGCTGGAREALMASGDKQVFLGPAVIH